MWSLFHSHRDRYADESHVLGAPRISATKPTRTVPDRRAPAHDFARPRGAQVAASLGITDAVVVGHAGGIPTAIALAAGYPDLVRALVCEEGAALPPDPAIESMVGAMIEQLSGPGYRDAMKAIYPGFFHPSTDPERVAAYAADAAETLPEVAVAYLAAMSSMDTATPARTLRMPVLFMWAEQPLIPITLEELQDSVPQAQLVEIPGTGHFAHLDAPKRFNDELERFIDGLEP